MDGDMLLDAGFLAAGVRFLEQHPTAAGVGGAIVHRDVANLEYEQRVKRRDPDRQPGAVTRLNGSALYRRSAIDDIGYLTDRNLHGCEELDLAARLLARGWTLARIDSRAIDHFGHRGSSCRLLLRRIVTGHAFGPGEIVRASLGRPYFGFVVRNERNILLSGLVVAWWLSIIAAAALAEGVQATLMIAALVLLPFVVMSWRWRSPCSGIYSVAVWNVLALCLLPGFLQPRVPPTTWLDSTVVQDPVIVRNHSRVVN
jgi:hypothetical protein